MMERKALFRPEKWREALKRYRYALLVVLAGALLLGLGGSGGGGEEKTQSWQEEAAFDLAATERRLEQTLSAIRGAGKVSVMLSLKEGTLRVLAQDTRLTDSEQSRSVVVISRGSGAGQPVQVQTVWPRYQGALVVCDGADDAAVRLELTQAVRAVTGLGAERISICKRQ